VSNSTPSHAAPVNAPAVITVLGVAQILAWGSSYYLLAVLAKPIAAETGWPMTWIVGGLSLGLLAAGVVSPRVGDTILRLGGRTVLIASALCFALGLVGLALSPSLPFYVMSWLVLGAGMGAGLYDAAFGTLGRLFGQRARMAIATLTLFGGFASTVCWPFSALLVSEFGWRTTCLVYAGIHLAILLPLYVFALPREPRREIPARGGLPGAIDPGAREQPMAGSQLIFCLFALAITISSMISTLLSVHLIAILQSRAMTLGAAVALGAIIGPSQVGARGIEMIISRFHHPIWTKLASTLFMALGIGLLWSGLPILPVAFIFYGAGIGIESIARGTLPLAVFGERRYPAIVGRIAMPSLIGQAAAPSLGAMLIGALGIHGMLAAVSMLAAANVALVIVLFGLLKRRSRSVAGISA
jgi:MFS family permease